MAKQSKEDIMNTIAMLKHAVENMETEKEQIFTVRADGQIKTILCAFKCCRTAATTIREFHLFQCRLTIGACDRHMNQVDNLVNEMRMLRGQLRNILVMGTKERNSDPL